MAVVAEHLVFALHGADRRFYHGPTGVAKDLARLKVGLLADHTLAADLLDLAVGVGDEPVPVQQLGGRAARIADRDGVRKYVTVRVRIGLIVDVSGLDAHLESVCVLLAHAGVLFYLIGEATVGRAEKQVRFRLHDACRHQKVTGAVYHRERSGFCRY